MIQNWHLLPKIPNLHWNLFGHFIDADNVWMALYTFSPASVKPIVTCCPQQIVLKHLLSCFGSCSFLFVRFRCSYKMIELILSIVFLPGGPLRGKLSRPDFSSLITCLLHFQVFDSSPPSWGIRRELLSQHFSHIPQWFPPFSLFSSCKINGNTLPSVSTIPFGETLGGPLFSFKYIWPNK